MNLRKFLLLGIVCLFAQSASGLGVTDLLGTWHASTEGFELSLSFIEDGVFELTSVAGIDAHVTRGEYRIDGENVELVDSANDSSPLVLSLVGEWLCCATPETTTSFAKD